MGSEWAAGTSRVNPYVNVHHSCSNNFQVTPGSMSELRHTSSGASLLPTMVSTHERFRVSTCSFIFKMQLLSFTPFANLPIERVWDWGSKFTDVCANCANLFKSVEAATQHTRNTGCTYSLTWDCWSSKLYWCLRHTDRFDADRDQNLGNPACQDDR